jgi:hypothetical protein
MLHTDFRSRSAVRSQNAALLSELMMTGLDDDRMHKLNACRDFELVPPSREPLGSRLLD